MNRLERLLEQQQSVERELRLMQLRYAVLLEQLPNVVLYETGGGREYISDNIEKMIGYTAQEITTDREVFPRLIHPDDSERVGNAIKNWKQAGATDVLTTEFRVQHKSGEYVWLEDHIILAHHEGEKDSMIGVMIDITNRRKAMEALRISEDRNRAIVEAATGAGLGLGIYLRKEKGLEVLYLNDAGAHMTGNAVEDRIGRDPMERVSESSREEMMALWDRASKGGSVPKSFELSLKHKQGFDVPISIGVSPTTVNNEEAFIAFFQDISERKKAEQELTEAKEQAEELSRIKSNILANFSHELRTPMHAILGFASLLMEDLENEEHRQYATSINRSGKRLLNTLSSILELATLESETRQIQLEPMLASDVLEELRTTYEPLAREQGLEFSTHAFDPTLTVSLDRTRMRKALDNILSNALKFTKRGSIIVSSSREFNARGRESAVLRVKDTGIGMSKEFLPHAFEEFKQESSGFGRTYEGTGLGLTLARSYVRLMHGDISIQSSPSKGTEVIISFPVG